MNKKWMEEVLLSPCVETKTGAVHCTPSPILSRVRRYLGPGYYLCGSDGKAETSDSIIFRSDAHFAGEGIKQLPGWIMRTSEMQPFACGRLIRAVGWRCRLYDGDKSM